MSAQHRTMRGEPIDIAAIAAKHSEKVALGNAKMNARGDIVGDGGIVLKTQEQIEAEWEAEKAKQSTISSKKANLKLALNDMLDNNQKAPVEKKLDDDADFDPAVHDVVRPDVVEQPDQTAKQTRKRKMTDTD